MHAHFGSIQVVEVVVTQIYSVVTVPGYGVSLYKLGNSDKLFRKAHES